MRTAHNSQSHDFCVSAFCINACRGEVKTGEMSTSIVRITSHNKYVSFDYTMRQGGMHQLQVYARCGRDSRNIHLNSDSRSFMITNFSRKGRRGNILLEIHDHIARMVPRCDTFQIFFHGAALDTPLCVNHVLFRPATSWAISK